MIRNVIGACIGSVVLAASGASVASEAIDLTGTYEATYLCEGTFDGFPFTESFAFEAQVVQQGAYIRIAYDDDGGVATIYQGVIRRVHPGGDFLAGLVQACGGDYEFEELLRIENGYEFAEEDGFTASFDGQSIYVTDDYPGSEGSLDIETCTYAFNRISTEEPKVATCDFRTRVQEVLVDKI